MIDRAIDELERLMTRYDDGFDITDIDLAHIVEILMGRE